MRKKENSRGDWITLISTLLSVAIVIFISYPDAGKLLRQRWRKWRAPKTVSYLEMRRLVEGPPLPWLGD